jgi:hypothetical protein
MGAILIAGRPDSQHELFRNSGPVPEPAGEADGASL